MRIRLPLRFVLLVGIYFAGAAVATWFVRRPDQIALIWPPTGFAFALLLSEGIAWWPVIAAGILLMHWFLAPVPVAFLPFSVAANVVSCVAAAWLVRRYSPSATRELSVRSGFALLRAALILVLISGPIGVSGMVFAGMLPPDQFWDATARWAMGDLFGLVAVTPAMLVAVRSWSGAAPPGLGFRYARLREKLAWAVALPLSLLGLLVAGAHGTAYALGGSSVSLAILLWSALRFEPVYALLGTLVTALYVAAVAGLGYSGFAQPENLVETTILLAFLCVSAIIPEIVLAATHETRVAAARLIRRATTDALTGLANRTAFEERCRELMRGHGNDQMALVYIDLDQIKLVNDTASHAAGDELIRGLSGVLRSALGAGELLARTGGDEFALLLKEDEPGAALERARGLRAAIANYRCAHHGQVLAATASLGVVPFRVGRMEFPALLARADAACFTAKDLGGNRVQLAATGEQDLDASTQAMHWAVRLGQALEQDRFLLYCQSIAPLRAEGDSGRRRFEILLRMIDPENGSVLLPGQFVAAAERFKLGVRLDRHVVDRVLGWLEDHPQAAAEVESCSVNLTAASLMDDEFSSWLQARIRSSGIEPGRLCFEVTETSAVRDLAKAQRFIQVVRALGCKFALDDFGAGFCSFAYLKALDVDYFKIDGGFVRELPGSPLALAIVRSIAEIARVLRKQTVAEFAETEAIRMHLGALGVDYAQGYAIDQPAPIEDYFATPPPMSASLLQRAG